jgi:hypothetical protein
LKEELENKGNDLYKVIGLEEEVGKLELVVWDKEKFLQERPQHRNTVNEEEQYRFETLTSRLLCVWHSAQQVIDKYYQLHREGKTTQSIINDIKDEIQKDKQNWEEVGIIAESSMSHIKKVKETSEKINRILNEEQIRQSTVVYDENGIKVTEEDVQKILEIYFEGTDLANVSYDWEEVISNVNLPTYLVNTSRLPQVSLNVAPNIIPLAADCLRFLASAGRERIKLNEQQNRRFEKEIKLRSWILEIAVENDNLKNKITTDPKLIVIGYKIDMGEEISWFYVATNQFNNHFGVNWSPLVLFSFLIGGLFGLIWLGYRFVRRVEAMVRRNNNNENSQEDNHED